MNKVLVLGASGLVGRAIIQKLCSGTDYEVYGTYHTQNLIQDQIPSYFLDLEKPHSISAILKSIKPNHVVSCLRGNFENQLALHEQVAMYIKDHGGTLYYFSTANVFDHDFNKVHFESDKPLAMSEYGQFKIKCEALLGDHLDVHEDGQLIIIRLPMVWGKDSPRMAELIQTLKQNEPLTVYPDLMINTITDQMIATRLERIITQNLKGTFHFGAKDEMSHKEFYVQLTASLLENRALEGVDLSLPLNQRFVDRFEESGSFALMTERNSEFEPIEEFTNLEVIGQIV